MFMRLSYNNNVNEVNNDQLNISVDALSKLKPGLLPKEIFYAVARLVVTPTYVVIPLYNHSDGLMVHLTPRSADDFDFPNMLHPVGKIILASDITLNDTFKRLWEKELCGAKISKGPVFVDIVYDEIPRGKEISLIHWALLDEKPHTGDLYNADKLPHGEIPKTDLNRISLALEHYKKFQM